MSHPLPQLTLTASTSSLSPFSRTLQSFRQSHLHKQALRLSTHMYPAMVHSRVADEHKSHLSQVTSPSQLSSKTSRPKRSSLKTSSPEELSFDRNLWTDPYQIQERFMRHSLIEDMDEFGKVDAETSYLQSQMHSDYDSSGEHCRLGS